LGGADRRDIPAWATANDHDIVTIGHRSGSLVGGAACLAIKQPEQQRQCEANDYASGDWEIERAMLAAKVNITGQATETKPSQQRPHHADRGQSHADNDKETSHAAGYGGPTSAKKPIAVTDVPIRVFNWRNDR
jgi:hypothetical protein